MASEKPEYFIRKKSSKRGLHLVTSGKYVNKKRQRHQVSSISSNNYSNDVPTSTFSTTSSFEEPSCSGLNFQQPPVTVGIEASTSASFDYSFAEAEPVHCSTPKQKEVRRELFPDNDLSPNAVIAKYYSIQESPPPLLIEKCRPIGQHDPHISSLTGRRIVDIAHVISASRNLENHECKVHPSGYLAFHKEEQLGFNSNIVFKCTVCATTRTICTNPAPTRKDNVNLAAVWGTIASGKGYYGMEELLSNMNVPIMSAKTFRKYHEEVGETWFESLTKAIEDAAAAEYRHAQDVGNMNGDIGEITVSLDGGWSQRSYNHGYTAKSGVAVIIGQRTKQILHLGVRNKYCSICAIAARKNCDAQPHQCYRNWTGSSPAMEADIIVEGFQSSESMFKLRYTTFIGDGDSSVRKRIEESVPYSRHITKIDCTNHLLKNIKKHLHKFSSENATNKKILPDRKI